MMRSAGIVSLLGTAVVCCFVLLSSKYRIDYQIEDITGKFTNHEELDIIKHTGEDFMRMKQHRDELSKTLIQLSKRHLQLQCKMILEKGNKGISTHGGWCNGSNDARGYHLDKKLVKGLIPLFQGQSVVSFGEGGGRYKKEFDESQQLEIFDGFDGSPFIENATQGLVKFIDLTVPLFGMRLYDWVICLSVGEHIPKEYESIVLDNLANHARKGIVLSWARPGQGGYGHVNCKTLESLVEELGKRGFSWDEKESKMIKSNVSIPYMKNDINLYRRKTSFPLNSLWN